MTYEIEILNDDIDEPYEYFVLKISSKTLNDSIVVYIKDDDDCNFLFFF